MTTGGLHWAHNVENTYVDLKRLVDQEHKITHQLCCVCMNYIPLDKLYVDDNGTKWDVCPDCQEKVRPVRLEL